ncbi:MAG TPA: alanine racemase [Candidatus Dormibacteraeota bacterium]|nr:alanine racemase [Candidatus Dormibacteraeota bacterium]
MDLERALAAVDGLETPVAVRDDAAMERNLARMAAVAERAGVRLRPHAKTHKSAAVGRRQLDHGAVGLTVATLQEAEVFADSGVADLVIAHPPAGRAKLNRLTHLAARVRRLAVALDDVELAVQVPRSVEILWEVDTGLHRVGTPVGEATLEAVRRLVAAVGQDRFRGLLTHGGHAYRAADQAQRRAAAAEESQGLVATAALIRGAGIAVAEVSVGSTPTAGFAPEFSGVSEIRPGTYVYGDANQVTLGSQALEDCALAVVATVVSTPAADRCVLDCGSKSLSADRIVAGLDGFGLVLGHPALGVARLSEEHAVLTAPDGTGLRVGDRVAVVPAHACTTVNLHPYLLAFDESGRSRWEAVEARGWR